MDQHAKRQIGEQIEPGGRPKAPGRLALLQQFLNTWNHELPVDWDRLGTAQNAQAWLRQKDLVAQRAQVSAVEAEDLRGLREAIRALAVANTVGKRDLPSEQTVRAAAAAAPLIVTVGDDGRTALRAHDPGGTNGTLATLLGILHEAQLTGTWVRLKGCRRCGYVFYDRSKNRAATWCSMSICGNRTKNRAHYRRHRPRLPGDAE